MAVRYRAYNPGLLTAVAINLPFSVYFIRCALVNGWASQRSLWIMLATAPVGMIIYVAISLWTGKLLAGWILKMQGNRV